MTPPTDTLAAALEREHREIDVAIESFLESRAEGDVHVEPLRQAVAALRRHIYLEEAFLFPALRDAGLFAPIFVMLREHGEIWDLMDTIDAQLSDDQSAGPSEEICRQLLAQLEEHNFKEEAVIYPRAGSVLDTGADAELHAFLASGRMPAGWVCERCSS